ncbi:MAG: hypothetical protein IKM94_03270 [Alphaproteobacteria bacterium]|nr:hypothetical protein [Alphaproteobacteria bacterium]
MKRNHIAIAGILASVLVTVDAAWAATDTGTVIASQAYVDATVGTKLNSSALNAGTLSTTSTTTVPSEKTVSDAITNAVSGIDTSAPAATTYVVDNATSAKSISSNDTDKAPSVRAVKNMVRASTATGGGVRATDSASDVLVPTEKAVATALVERLNNSANTNTNAIIATDTKFAANPAIQKGVLYMKGAGLDNHSAEAGLSTTTAENSWTTADGTNNSIKTIRESNKMDDYVPTMAAVEARVKAAEGLIPTVPGGTNTKSATYSSTGHTLTVADSGDGASTSKYATPKQVANTITDVKSYIDYKDGLKANTADLGALATLNAVGSAQITDGSIAAGDLASDSVITEKIKNLNVTTDKLAADAVTNAKLADNAVQTENIKDGTIVNADISDTAAIAYTKMNGTLKDVNSTSADASCTAASPCVLTYYKIGSNVYYKWTNLIETDGVTALPAS